MLRKVLIFTVAALSLILVQTSLVKAVTPTPASTIESKEINSFELFWPVTAGKVSGDTFYWLKTLKEDIREALIFGNAQKSDYQVFRSTKRIVEAEKLLNEGKNDLGIKTLDRSLGLLENAKASWTKAKENESADNSERENIDKQLGNLKTFLTYLSTKYTGDVKNKIDQNIEKVQESLDSL